VSIKGIKILELRVTCKGPNRSAHAVWLDPWITGASSIPSAADQAVALDRVKQTSKGFNTVGNSKELTDLANRLLRQGESPMNWRPLQFVLLREARDKAADAGRVDLALEAVDEMARHFDIDLLEDKATALEHARDAATSADSIKQLVKGALDLVKETISVDDYKTAHRLLIVADFAAARSENPKLQGPVRSSSNKVRALAEEYEKVKPELDKLKDNPGDAAAKLAVGRYYCFAKRDWEHGLPYLARGSDPALADLANLELRQSSSPDSWLKLADGWRQLAAKEDATAKEPARRKAYGWYKKAYPEVSDKDVARVEKFMNSFAPEHWWLDVLDVSQADAKQDKKTHYLHLEPGKSIATLRRFSGPVIIQATVKTDHSLMLHAFDNASIELHEEKNQHWIRVVWPDPNRKPEKNIDSKIDLGRTSPFIARGKQTIKVQITKTEIHIVINNVTRRSVSAPGKFDGSRRGPIVLSSPNAAIEVYSLRVSPGR
jgi:hypothetical protein